MPLAILGRALIGLMLLAGTQAALAADPVFPINSRVGLVPPPGFTASTRFSGFENPKANAVILLAAMPSEAFAELEKGFSNEALKQRGMTVATHEAMTFKDGKGVFIAGPRDADGQKRYEAVVIANVGGAAALASVQMLEASRAAVTDAMLRDSLKTIVIREVPDAEKLSILPYKIGDLAGFHVVRTAGDGSAVLTFGPKDTAPISEQPFLVVGLSGTGQEIKAEDRDKFARQFFTSAPGVKDVKITRAEPLRIGQLQGHEIVAEAKEASTSTDVTMVQWVRFGHSGQMTMLAIVPRGAWNTVFPKLRAIRDGIELTRVN